MHVEDQGKFDARRLTCGHKKSSFDFAPVEALIAEDFGISQRKAIPPLLQMADLMGCAGHRL
jgi:hypothetical protein